jgi:predicted RNA-binding protein (virulence factor B family)
MLVFKAGIYLDLSIHSIDLLLWIVHKYQRRCWNKFEGHIMMILYMDWQENLLNTIK